MMTPAQAIERVADYIEANAHRLHDWVPEDRATLTAALGFHALNGTLRVEWQKPKAETFNIEHSTFNAEFSPAGLAIVWPDLRAEVERLDRAKQSVFRWLPPLPGADCLYLGLVITTRPGVLPKLAAWFRSKFPPLPQLAHRRGKLMEFDWLARLGESSKQQAENRKELYG